METLSIWNPKAKPLGDVGPASRSPGGGRAAEFPSLPRFAGRTQRAGRWGTEGQAGLRRKDRAGLRTTRQRLRLPITTVSLGLAQHRLLISLFGFPFGVVVQKWETLWRTRLTGPGELASGWLYQETNHPSPQKSWDSSTEVTGVPRQPRTHQKALIGQA